MPGRNYQPATPYRYGMNGQEKDDEIAQGIYTAMYWEYDSRIGRRWNRDPKPTAEISDYACFNNNPVLQTDVNGDVASGGKEKTLPGTEIADDSPLKTPKFQMRIGNNLSTPSQQMSGTSHKTLAFSSQVGIYNTNVKHLFGIGLPGNSFLSGENDASEGDHFFQFMGRVGKSDWQIGVTGYKEKVDYNALGQGWEAPTNALFTVGKNFPASKTFFKDNLQVGANIAGGVGGLYGMARLQGYGNLDAHYNRIGTSAALIVRFDATIAHNYVLWIAATATGNHIDANRHGWSSFNYSVLGLKGGLGINIGTSKSKRPEE
jgi:hypothetical protein